MIKSKKIKYVIGLIGAILIGAIGSGIWEVALEPAFSYVSNASINFISSIFTSLEDSMYESIAKSYTEESSYMAVTLILFIYFFFLGFSTSILLPSKKMEKSALDENAISKLDELKNRLSIHKEKVRKRGLVLLSVMVLISVFVLSQSSVLKFKLDKISNYDQYIKIVKPFISQSEYDQFNSSFAQIKNSNDYNKILDSLKHIASLNKIK